MKSRKPLIVGSFITAVVGMILFGAATVPRQTLRYPLMQTDADGGHFCWTNLSCIQADNVYANNVLATNSVTTTTLTATNISAGTITVSNLTATNINVTTINNNSFSQLSNVQLLEVFDMLTNAVLASQFTNRYWMNMGKTNSMGQIDIYASLTPTNDIQLELPTNGFRGGLLSANILARGGNRTIFFPTNFSAFNTNDANMILRGSRYVLVLTNGNEFRFTIQSNATYSVMTKTFGQ